MNIAMKKIYRYKILVLAGLFWSPVAFSSVILAEQLGKRPAQTVVSLEEYFSLLCTDCTEKAHLPRFYGAIQSFPANGGSKIDERSDFIIERIPELRRSFAYITEFVRVLKSALDKSRGVSEFSLLKTIFDNRDIYDPALIQKVSELRIKESYPEVMPITVALMEKLERTPTWVEIKEKLCATESASDKPKCLGKHDSLMLLEQVFTAIGEQFGEGIRFCKDAAACAARPSLYSALQKRWENWDIGTSR